MSNEQRAAAVAEAGAAEVLGVRKPIRVGFVLDESGSMAGRALEVISAVNEYVEIIKGDPDYEYDLSIYAFHSAALPVFRPLYEEGSVKDYTPLKPSCFQPDGGTPLYDAIGKLITRLDVNADNYGRVVMMIFTDGQNNASLEFDFKAVQDLIEAKKALGWEIVFMGETLDVVGASRDLGASAYIDVHGFQGPQGGVGMGGAMQANAVRTMYYARTGDFMSAPLGTPDDTPDEDPKA